MANINDLPKIEGIRDFFRGEIYGEVSRLLDDRGVFGDKKDPLYMESLTILGCANRLVDILLDDHIPEEEKEEMIDKAVHDLYKRLADLKKQLLIR